MLHLHVALEPLRVRTRQASHVNHGPQPAQHDSMRWIVAWESLELRDCSHRASGVYSATLAMGKVNIPCLRPRLLQKLVLFLFTLNVKTPRNLKTLDTPPPSNFSVHVQVAILRVLKLIHSFIDIGSSHFNLFSVNSFVSFKIVM